MDKELCKNIGKLLKKADDLQMCYYQFYDRVNLESAPHEMIGGKCLKTVLNNPSQGIKLLQKHVLPFLSFCKAQVKKRDNDNSEREKYGKKIKDFNDLLLQVSEASPLKMEVDNKEKFMLDFSSQNIIFLEYLI